MNTVIAALFGRSAFPSQVLVKQTLQFFFADFSRIFRSAAFFLFLRFCRQRFRGNGICHNIRIVCIRFFYAVEVLHRAFLRFHTGNVIPVIQSAQKPLSGVFKLIIRRFSGLIVLLHEKFLPKINLYIVFNLFFAFLPHQIKEWRQQPIHSENSPCHTWEWIR